MGMIISVVQWKVTIKSDSQSLPPAIATSQFLKDIGAAELVRFNVRNPIFLKAKYRFILFGKRGKWNRLPFILFGEWGSVLLQP